MRPVNHAPSPSGIGGWLLILCLLLLIWQPISVGLVASRSLGALPAFGLPAILILLARLLVASLGIAAGLALLGRRPGAAVLAKVSLLTSAATELFVYTTPYFPNSRAPGETPLVVLGSLTYYTAWLIYLHRSKRVKNTLVN